MQLPYPINLIGANELEAGDVVTQHGEIVGTWTLIHGALYNFTPLGADKPLFTDPHIPCLCRLIGEWLETQEG